MGAQVELRLKELRGTKGLTKEGLARRVGCTLGAVNAWEAGKAVPTRKFLAKLAEVLEVDVPDLFARKSA